VTGPSSNTECGFGEVEIYGQTYMNTTASTLTSLQCPISVTVNGDKTSKVILENIVDY